MLKELSSICARQALCWATPHPSNSFETLSRQTKSTWSLVPDCLFWDSGFKGKRQCVAEQRQQTSQKARRQRTSGSSWETMFGGPTKLSTITAVHKGKEQSQESRKHTGLEEQETKYLWTRTFLESWTALIDGCIIQTQTHSTVPEQVHRPLFFRRHINELYRRIPSQVAGKV